MLFVAHSDKRPLLRQLFGDPGRRRQFAVACDTRRGGGEAGKVAAPRWNVRGGMTALYVDGDACPVREEVFRVADRPGPPVYIVSNGSRPFRSTGRSNVRVVTVPVAPSGKHWTTDNIGNALARWELSRHLRDMGMNGGGPPPLTRQGRARFLGALDVAVQATLRAIA